jgi:hypothetical protein
MKTEKSIIKQVMYGVLTAFFYVYYAISVTSIAAWLASVIFLGPPSWGMLMYGVLYFFIAAFHRAVRDVFAT